MYYFFRVTSVCVVFDLYVDNGSSITIFLLYQNNYLHAGACIYIHASLHICTRELAYVCANLHMCMRARVGVYLLILKGDNKWYYFIKISINKAQPCGIHSPII